MERSATKLKLIYPHGSCSKCRETEDKTKYKMQNGIFTSFSKTLPGVVKRYIAQEYSLIVYVRVQPCGKLKNQRSIISSAHNHRLVSYELNLLLVGGITPFHTSVQSLHS